MINQAAATTETTIPAIDAEYERSAGRQLELVHEKLGALDEALAPSGEELMFGTSKEHADTREVIADALATLNRCLDAMIAAARQTRGCDSPEELAERDASEH